MTSETMKTTTMKTARWYLVLVFSMAVFTQSAYAMVVQSSVKHKQVTVQQGVALTIKVLSPNWFTSEPEISFETTDTMIVLDTPVYKGPANETVEGQRLNGVMFEFLLFPTTAGRLKVPTFSVKATEGGASSIEHDWQSQQTLWLTVEAIPSLPEKGSPNQSSPLPIVVANQVTLEEQWQGDNPELSVGSSVKRSLSIRAEGTSAQMIQYSLNAALNTAQSTEALDIQLQSATVDNAIERGEVIGHWQQSLNYYPQQPGDIQTPPIQVLWYNPSTGNTTELAFEQKTWTVKGQAPTNLNKDSTLKPASHQKKSIQLIVGVTLLSGLFLMGVGLFIHRKKPIKTNPIIDPYQNLLIALNQNNHPSIIPHVYRWSLQLTPPQRDYFTNHPTWKRFQQDLMEGGKKVSTRELKALVVAVVKIEGSDLEGKEKGRLESLNP